MHQINSVLHLPNGHHSKVTHIGSVHLHTNIVLTDVLYVPSFNYNLLYIHKLTSTNSCNVFFTKDACYVQDHVLKRTTENGELQDGLYLLHHLIPSTEQFPNMPTCSNIQSVCNNVTKNVDISHLWHARLGHPSVSSMKFLPQIMYHNSITLMNVILVIWLNKLG